MQVVRSIHRSLKNNRQRSTPAHSGRRVRKALVLVLAFSSIVLTVLGLRGYWKSVSASKTFSIQGPMFTGRLLIPEELKTDMKEMTQAYETKIKFSSSDGTFVLTYDRAFPSAPSPAKETSSGFSVCGVAYMSELMYGNVWMRWRLVSFPFWYPVVLAAIWPMASLARVWHRRRTGLCPSCGYDLRASTDRCPECGSPITKQPEAVPK